MTAPRVALAGSTGSIGTQTLEVLAAEPDRFELTALGASGRNRPTCSSPRPRRYRPKVVAVADEAAAAELAGAPARVRGPRRRRAPGQPGRRGRRRASTAWSASPGCRSPWPPSRPGAGWRWPTRSRSSPPGPVVQRARRTPGAELVPVDSEHCALHQCLRANDNAARVGAPGAHRQRRPVPGPHRGRARRGHRRRRPGPPDVVAWGRRSPSTPRRS